MPRENTPIFKEEKWLDNQEVCLMMNITKRTLQTYKDKGLLPYSKLNRKNYYKRSDVQALLEAGQPYNTMTMDLFTNDNEEIIAHQEMITQLRNRIERNIEKLPSCNERRNIFVGRRCVSCYISANGLYSNTVMIISCRIYK
jgi:DNA-binding transcriptional MerR regulator